MVENRPELPHRSERLFLTDGGIETTLMFHEGLELPELAAFHLLATEDGEATLLRYFETYAGLARRYKTNLILESPTWRASSDWGRRLGYSRSALGAANRKSISMMKRIRDKHAEGGTDVVVSGCIGPRGDGYVPSDVMSSPEAEAYHRDQSEWLSEAGADMLCGITMNYVEEAIGIAKAAKRIQMPVAISFTVETDGRLPTGQSLPGAIEQVDQETEAYPAYYMINCAHPTHFEHVFANAGSWIDRIRGLRANASCKSHAELNESTELDAGDPEELGLAYARLKQRIPNLNVMGGCCGTDDRHIEKIAWACRSLFN